MPSGWRAACPASAAPTSARLGRARSVTGARGSWPQGRVIRNEPGRRMGRRGRREAAGTRHRGSCASGCRCRGGFEYNTPCGWESDCILHDSSERSEVFIRARSGCCGFLSPSGLSPPASGRGTERSRATGARSTPSGVAPFSVARSGAGASRSGVQQPEMDGVRLLASCGGSLRTNRGGTETQARVS